MSKNTPPAGADKAEQDLSAQLQAQVEELQVKNAQLQAQLEAAQESAASAKRSQHAGRGTHVRVSSAHPNGSHWRAGRLWSRETQDVAIKDLGAEQMQALRADRHLVVVDL